MNKIFIGTIVFIVLILAAIFLTFNIINRHDVVTKGTAYGFNIDDLKEICFNTLLATEKKYKYDYIFHVPSDANDIDRMNKTIENIMENNGSLKSDKTILDQNNFRIEINKQNKNKIMNLDSWKIMIKTNLFINQLQLYFSDDKLVKIVRTREMFESP